MQRKNSLLHNDSTKEVRQNSADASSISCLLVFYAPDCNSLICSLKSNFELQSHASVSVLLHKIQPLKDNDDIERNKTAELLTVLAGSVKALQSNQLEFNASVNVLADLFLRIYNCSPRVSPINLIV